MKTVLFDLDDTLYREFDFVQSGYRAVAGFCADKFHLEADEVFAQLIAISEQHGRGRVFDILLERLDLYSKECVRELIDVYRFHTPQIQLGPQAKNLLEELCAKNFLLGLITDGMASVQKSKVKALGIAPYFKTIVYTDELGEGLSKPSPVPYKTALDNLGAAATESMYVGDNPAKDFHAPKSMGMATIQIKNDDQRHFVTLPQTNCVEAERVVHNLAEAAELILKGEA